MSRNGVIVAGGILGVLRGTFGGFIGLGGVATVNEIDRIIPGYSGIFWFELLLSIGILIVAIYALVKAKDPSAAGDIKGWGIAIIIAGVVDLVWALALVGGAPESVGAALGSLAALALIGGLLAAGATSLGKTESK